jgi:glycosyltransferase involved in cell wall biosynthesis
MSWLSAESEAGEGRDLVDVEILEPFVDGHHPGYALGLMRELRRRGLQTRQVTLDRPLTRVQWLKLGRWQRLRLYRALLSRCTARADTVRVWPCAELFMGPFAITGGGSQRDILIFHHDLIFVSRMRGWLLRNLKRGPRIVVHPNELYERLKSHEVDCIHADIPTDHRERIPKAEARYRLAIERAKVLLTIGQIRGDKGIQEMVDVWDDVVDKLGADVLWVIAGEDRVGLRRSASRQVRYDLRTLSEHELDLYLSVSDVVVLPYPKSVGLSGIVVRPTSENWGGRYAGRPSAGCGRPANGVL